MDSSPSLSLFSSLPTELRLKIWECCLPGPRMVPVRYSRFAKRYISVATPPPLLNTCVESRQVFLAHYTRLILSPRYPSSVYVSFEFDTIFFDSLDCSPQGDLAHDLACSPHSDRILKCAIDVQLWEVLRVFRFDSLSEVRLLKNVKTIALVMRSGRKTADEEAVDREMGIVGRASDRRDSLFYAENLRKMLCTVLTRNHWGNGVPSVQLCFQ